MFERAAPYGKRLGMHRMIRSLVDDSKGDAVTATLDGKCQPDRSRADYQHTCVHGSALDQKRSCLARRIACLHAPTGSLDVVCGTGAGVTFQPSACFFRMPPSRLEIPNQ